MDAGGCSFLLFLFRPSWLIKLIFFFFTGFSVTGWGVRAFLKNKLVMCSLYHVKIIWMMIVVVEQLLLEANQLGLQVPTSEYVHHTEGQIYLSFCYFFSLFCSILLFCVLIRTSRFSWQKNGLFSWVSFSSIKNNLSLNRQYRKYQKEPIQLSYRLTRLFTHLPPKWNCLGKYAIWVYV